MAQLPHRTRTIDLGYEQMLLIDNGPGTRVRVLHGATWLTEEGHAEDAFMGSGTERALRSRGTTLIEGLGPSRIEVREDAPAGRLSRLLGAYAATIARWSRRLRARTQLGPQPCVGADC